MMANKAIHTWLLPLLQPHVLASPPSMSPLQSQRPSCASELIGHILNHPVVFTLVFSAPRTLDWLLPSVRPHLQSQLTPGVFSDHLCIIATPPPPHPPSLVPCFLPFFSIYHHLTRWLVCLLFVDALKTETVHMDRLHVCKVNMNEHWIYPFHSPYLLAAIWFFFFFLLFLICLPCVSFKSFHIFGNWIFNNVCSLSSFFNFIFFGSVMKVYFIWLFFFLEATTSLFIMFYCFIMSSLNTCLYWIRTLIRLLNN